MLKQNCIFILIFMLCVVFSFSKTIQNNTELPQLNSKEFKILLKANKFKNSNAGTRTFLQLVTNLAAEEGIPFSAGPNRKEVSYRTVYYLDTKDFSLYKKNYILRKRTKKNKVEYVLKFRSSDFSKVQNSDVYSSFNFPQKIKFEEDVTVSKDSKLKSLFSLSNKVKNSLNDIPMSIKGLSIVWPVIGKLGISDRNKLYIVNQKIVTEKEYEPGTLFFDDNTFAKTALSVWYIGKKKIPDIAEFSFKIKYDKEYSNKKVYIFFKKLIAKCKKWKNNSKTKTELIYFPSSKN